MKKLSSYCTVNIQLTFLLFFQKLLNFSWVLYYSCNTYLYKIKAEKVLELPFMIKNQV